MNIYKILIKVNSQVYNSTWIFSILYFLSLLKRTIVLYICYTYITRIIAMIFSYLFHVFRMTFFKLYLFYLFHFQIRKYKLNSKQSLRISNLTTTNVVIPFFGKYWNAFVLFLFLPSYDYKHVCESLFHDERVWNALKWLYRNH